MTPSAVQDGSVGGVLLTVILAYLLLALRAGLVRRHAEKRAIRGIE
jgi:hypothetical protein